jgi:hypothetical protein
MAHSVNSDSCLERSLLGNSAHRAELALNGSVANDPKQTFVTVQFFDLRHRFEAEPLRALELCSDF